MKKKVPVGIIAIAVIAASAMLTGCIKQEQPALGATIQIEAKTSTWRGGQEPYDIYSAIKEKLEKAGFEVVSNDSGSYDSMLLIDYKEEKSFAYSLLGQPAGYATDIKCNVKFYDRGGNLLFEKGISCSSPKSFTAPPSINVTNGAYNSALFYFKCRPYFVCLGEIIASIYSTGDEVPGLIHALEHGETTQLRLMSARILGEIGDKRAIEPLTACLDDKEVIIREEAERALDKIEKANK